VFFDLLSMAVAVMFLVALLTVGLWLVKGALILLVGAIVLPIKLSWWVVKGVFGLLLLGLVVTVFLSLFGPLLAVVLPIALLVVVLPILVLGTLFGSLSS
jgi:hypothetical protein